MDQVGDLNDSVPQDMFVQEEMAKGATFPEATDRWNEIVRTCEDSSKEWHEASQQWLLLKFRGVRRFAGNESKKTSALERSKEIKDAADFEDAEELRKQTLDGQRSLLRKVKSQAASSSWNASEFENLHITREDGASGPLVTNAPLPGDATMSKQIYQEAQVAAGEGARQLEADERDEHMAREQDRLKKKKAGPGRPKKAKTALFADCMKLIQDKKANLVHCSDSAKSASKEAQDEADKDFHGKLPDGFEGLKRQMNEDLNKEIDENMAKLIKSLDDLNVPELVGTEGESFDTDKMKKKLVELLAPLKL